MQTVLNILVILSLAVQNVFAVLRPAAIDAKPQGNAKAASVLPKSIKDQITDPATDVPAPVSAPQDAETLTSTPEVKETATPEVPTVQPSQTPVPADIPSDTPAAPTDTQTPVVETPTGEAPTETPPAAVDLPTETPPVDTATATLEAPTATPTGSPTIPGKLLAPATVNLTDAQSSALVQLNGAVLTAMDGQVKVNFPAKAISKPMLVSIAAPGADKIPYTLSDHAFEVLATDPDSKAEIHQFKSNLTIQVTFDPAEFPDNASYLKLYYYDTKTKDWISLITQIDFDNHLLTAQVDHLTVFDFDADNINLNHLPDLSPFDVSSYSGAATYSISLNLPPAPAGLTPKLTLSYNSQTVDEMDMPAQGSWVGTGWNLETPYIDGNKLHFLHLNGASYTLVPLNNGGLGTIYYKTDPATSLQIRGYGGSLSQSVFKVYDQDGTFYLFDYRATMPAYDGCNFDHTETYRWYVSSVSKMVNGFTQTVNYTYANDNNSKAVCSGDRHNLTVAVYPLTIEYGGENNDLYQVKFNTENRYDFESTWLNSDNFTLFMDRRLTSVEITYKDPSQGIWVTLRKYVFTYAGEDDPDIIFPGYTWDPHDPHAPAHTITLRSVQEFGENNAALPATTFTYSDNMHLTDAENGYGGKVHYEIDFLHPWYDTDHLYQKDQSYSYNSECSSAGWSERGTASVGCTSDFRLRVRGGSKEGFPDGWVTRAQKSGQYKPGAMYHLKMHVHYTLAQDVEIRGKIGADATFAAETDFPPKDANDPEIFFRLPEYAPESLPWGAVACTNCEFSSYVLERLPTHYRVTQKTLTDEITHQSYTFQYHYDDAATNDADHSLTAATFADDHQLIHERNEFRGNAQVDQIGPDGKLTTTWFHQDDAFKGQPAAVMTGKQSFHDGFNGDGLDPYAWTDDSGSVQTVRIGGDNALQLNSTAPINLTRRSSLHDKDSVVVQFRMTADVTSAELKLVNGGSNVGLYVAPNAASHGFTTNAPPGGDLITILPDHWYVLMISTGGDHTSIRVWQRDVDCHTDGSDPYEVIHCSNDSDQAEIVEGNYQGGAANDWTFQVSAQTSGLGKLYIDEYSEDQVYSLSQTFYKDTPTASTCDYNKPVISIWTRPVEQRQYTYDGSDWIASRTRMQYLESDQDGMQYGNLTRSIDGEWQDGDWKDYRITHTVYIPNPAQDGDDFYTPGLPALQESYECSVNHPCDNLEDDTLISKTLYCYDWDNAFCQRVPNQGTLTAVRTLLNSNGQYNDTFYGYDAYGNQTSVTKYTGTGTAGVFASVGPQTTTTDYDDTYHLYPLSTTDDLGHTMTWEYDFGKGVPTRETDYNGNSTSATYDDFGRLLNLFRPGDGDPTLGVTYTHTTNGPYIVDIQQRIDGTNTYHLRQVYDGLGRKIQMQTRGAKVNGTTQDIITDTWYDAYGKVIRQSVPYNVGDGGTGLSGPDGSQPHSSTHYDVLGRVTKSVATDGAETNTGYSLENHELMTVVTDQKNNSTTSWTDVRGRVTKVTPATGPEVNYSYDPNDRLNQAIYGGATTSIVYDLAGRKTNMTDADMGAWAYIYDALGNLTTQSDARGCTTTLTYDTLNRLTGKTYSGCPQTDSVNYIYDEATNGAGQRTFMSDSSGWTHWSYDTRGRMVQEARYVADVGTFTTQWDYFSDDQVAAIRYPKDDTGMIGEEVKYSYQPQKTLNSLKRFNEDIPEYEFQYLSGASYDAAGRIVQRKMNANIDDSWSLQSNFSYYPWNPGREGNSQGRLQNIQSGPSSDPSALQDLEYQYDQVGNITNITDWNNGSGQNQVFTYDSLNRLRTAVTDDGGNYGSYAQENYTYDSSTGNLSEKGPSNNLWVYSYDTNHKHAVATITLGGVTLNSYNYDYNGNMVTRVLDGVTYTLGYDAENRLTHVVSSDGQTSAVYVYDGDGKMVEKSETISGHEVKTIYIGNLLELQLPNDLPDVTPTVPTRTATRSTRTAVPTLSATLPPPPSDTATSLPSITATTTATRTSTSTFTKTSSPTRTPTNTKTSSKTPGPSPTKTNTSTKTFTLTSTVRTSTTVWTASPVPSITPTKSKTPTGVVSDITPSLTPTITKTPKPVQTIVVVTPEVLTNKNPTWRFYYYAGDARIAMRVINGANDMVFFLFADHLGSTNVTSDPSGQIVGLSLYMPWGGSRAGGAGTRLTDYGFTGQREMGDSVGLIYYGARFYDPALGRWTQPDTIVPQASQGVQAWDRFAYTNNNPVLYNDKTGHDVGCGREDDSECGSSTTFEIACGRDGDTCDANSETMKPYYDYALKHGYQVYYYDPDTKKTDGTPKYGTDFTKYNMAEDMAKKIKGNPENDVYVFGHSAGGDAAILATGLAAFSKNIKGVALLDPSMTAAIPGGKDKNNSIQSQADQIASKGIPVFLGDSPKDGINASIAGATRVQYDYEHIDMATKMDVFNAVMAFIMR